MNHIFDNIAKSITRLKSENLVSSFVNKTLALGARIGFSLITRFSLFGEEPITLLKDLTNSKLKMKVVTAENDQVVTNGSDEQLKKICKKNQKHWQCFLNSHKNHDDFSYSVGQFE